VVGEGVAVANAEVLENELAGIGKAGRHLPRFEAVSAGQAATCLSGRRHCILHEATLAKDSPAKGTKS
jgi:hypothetical protein